MTGVLAISTLAPLAVIKPNKTKPRKAAQPAVGRSLGIVLRQLRAAQSLLPGAAVGSAPRAASPRIAKGAQYLSRTHSSAAGSRDCKIYLPARQPRRPKGLIMMLHGCHQTPDDFALGSHMNALAEKHGFSVAYPAQTARQNAALCSRCGCWTWPGTRGRAAARPGLTPTEQAQKPRRKWSGSFWQNPHQSDPITAMTGRNDSALSRS